MDFHSGDDEFLLDPLLPDFHLVAWRHAGGKLGSLPLERLLFHRDGVLHRFGASFRSRRRQLFSKPLTLLGRSNTGTEFRDHAVYDHPSKNEMGGLVQPDRSSRIPTLRTIGHENDGRHVPG